MVESARTLARVSRCVGAWPAALLAAAALGVGACGGGNASNIATTATRQPATPQPATPQPATPQPAIPQPVIPVVVGKPVVTEQPYGLPNTTGYETAVAITLANRSDQPVVNAPFRVTVTGGGKILNTSAGEDTVTLAPREQRVVVATADLKGTRPRAATVKTYAGLPSPDVTVPDPSKWKITDARLSCDPTFVGCDVTADVTWTGTEHVSFQRIDAVVRRGVGGPIVAGGQAHANSEPAPGKTVPVSGHVSGRALEGGHTSGLVVDLAVQPVAGP